MEHIIFIDGDSARVIHDDELVGLRDSLGDHSTSRASDVEMEDGEWVADMARVGGPKLSRHKFRRDALLEEREWLNEHHLSEGK